MEEPYPRGEGLYAEDIDCIPSVFKVRQRLCFTKSYHICVEFCDDPVSSRGVNASVLPLPCPLCL